MFKIEIDVDGVLANLVDNPIIRERVRTVYPEYTAACVTKYDFSDLKEVNIDAYNIIFASFKDVDYMSSLPLFDGVIEGLQRLHNLPVKMHVHTLIKGSMENVRGREAWLNQLTQYVPFDYTVDYLTKNMFNDTDILIEDCPANIEASNAKIKILIQHNYNKDYAETCRDVIVAQDFNHATRIIEELVNNAAKTAL